MWTKFISFAPALSYNYLSPSDPLNTKTDAELTSLLQRAWLLPQDGVKDPAAEAKFSLDASVGDEGSNFSAGEKQLLALCRALVRDSSLIILVSGSTSCS
jgi:ATP-binding cassette, subfamily C (CFTR/MRP), member 1